MKDIKNKNREQIAKEYNIDLSLVRQVFLIAFDNCDMYKFLDLLDKLGDYKTNSTIVDEAYIHYAYVNTNVETRKIKKMFDKEKEERDIISIAGLTIDMMMAIEDSEDREWCFARQKENMDYLLSKQQKNTVKTINDILDKIEQEALRDNSSQEKANTNVENIKEHNEQ